MGACTDENLRWHCSSFDDIKHINENCMVSYTHKPPKGVQVSTYMNNDQDAINSAMFEE
jgi:hypothetical protein